MDAPKAKKDQMFDGNQATTTATSEPTSIKNNKSDTQPKSSNHDQPEFINSHHPLIFLDTSVILKAIGFNNDNESESEDLYDFLEQNKERIKVLKKVKHEAEQKLKHHEEDISEMKKKMTLFEGREVESYSKATESATSYLKAIKNVNEMHAYALVNWKSEIANEWRRSKKKYLEDSKEQFDSESESDLEWLQIKSLHNKAESDRAIMADALMLAEQENVILISDDGDFTAFHDNLFKLATCWLQVGYSSQIPGMGQKNESSLSLKEAYKYAQANFCTCKKECTCIDDLYDEDDWCPDLPTAKDISYAYSHLSLEGINFMLTDLDKWLRDYFYMVYSTPPKK